MKASAAKKKRRSRSDWLAVSMDVLSREGGAKLNINHLCKKLGVTKGSFYAHFKGRADFVEQFLDYWTASFTQTVIVEIDGMKEAPPEERLLTLMKLLHYKGMAAYDVAVRAWAAQEPVVAETVKRVDSLRFAFARRIFHEIGFRGVELDLRTRIFVVYHSSTPFLVISQR